MSGQSEQRKSHTENFLHSTTIEDTFNNKIPNNLRSHNLLLVHPHGLESSSDHQNCCCHLESNHRKSYGHLYQSAVSLGDEKGLQL